ncbi:MULTISPECIES: dihydrodipicolinate reductase C-terminal domain-containing protein [unclassified Micromonospora]|uniref:dihydrodipicolinate reductase C-terminal domain-containing protein n=1 Tax=unclassified Micromonospora TaxID=2617518 RepID=UPI001C60422D|nr:dihydrodipicolinate reductase C-terminal domain-containing protein [Micromonospora sp. RL09-050-HVF-A]MBW4704209.1 hypothetical protein [Micromonospora sp. RL09-050-HVF-A]
MSEPVLGVVGRGRLGTAVRDLARAEGHEVRVYASRALPDPRTETAPDVVVDCSAPAALTGVAELCHHWRRPLVQCVSGLDEQQEAVLGRLGRSVAVVAAPNLTLGNYLLSRAVRCVAEVVTTMARAGVTGAVPEAAVFERHPARKAHRPSTTAVQLSRLWTSLTGHEVSDVASLRAGDAVSDHELRLGWDGQSLALVHTVGSIRTAAAGAIGIAAAATSLPVGVHHAHDVFDQMLAVMGGDGGKDQR